MYYFRTGSENRWSITNRSSVSSPFAQSFPDSIVWQLKAVFKEAPALILYITKMQETQTKTSPWWNIYEAAPDHVCMMLANHLVRLTISSRQDSTSQTKSTRSTRLALVFTSPQPGLVLKHLIVYPPPLLSLPSTATVVIDGRTSYYCLLQCAPFLHFSAPNTDPRQQLIMTEVSSTRLYLGNLPRNGKQISSEFWCCFELCIYPNTTPRA